MTIPSSSFTFGSETLQWSEWVPGDGVFGDVIAIDTETSEIKGPGDVPALRLVSASDGRRHVVIRPENIAAWLVQHVTAGTHIVFHNVAFDFWVLVRFLAKAGERSARRTLWAAVDQHRVHDTMLLSQLVRLARTDQAHMESLAILAKRRLGVTLLKDAYRLEYDTLVGRDWAEVDPGFFVYAIRDALATYRVYRQLEKEAAGLCEQYQLPVDHGLLTEALQVKAAVSLARVTLLGIGLDMGIVTEGVRDLDTRIAACARRLDTLSVTAARGPVLRPLHPRAKPGSRRSKDTKALRAYLEDVVLQNGLDIPRGSKGELTLSIKETWSKHVGVDPVVDAWIDYERLTKAHSFFANLQEPRIHPSYTTLVRTGRTSCSKPNIQQLPRDLKVRDAVVARPGHVLFAIDYTCLELRTLATVCHDRYGVSKLREVLIAGIDPHSYTAAMFSGMTLEEFEKLPDDERDQRRQWAKPFNFGVPGGMGTKVFVQTAESSYGIKLTIEEAEAFVGRLCGTVYPELRRYLLDDAAGMMADELGTSRMRLMSMWPKAWEVHLVRRVVAGKPWYSDGKPYDKSLVDRLWMNLEYLCEDPQLKAAIKQRDVSDESPLRRLLGKHVTSRTGRVRSPVSYSQARNTPFQGLAADGCKEVMWRLLKRGYRVIAFVHDEFVIEVPESDDYRPVADEIVRICKEGMQPFIPGIPVECEFAVTHRWLKKAKAVYLPNGALVPWSPPPQAEAA